MSVCGISINGRLTGYGVTAMSSYEVAKPYRSEINAYGSWYVNFNDGYVNNFGKFGCCYVRPCTANVEYRIILQTVWEAYEDCLEGKRSSPQTLEYMPKAAEDIPQLAWEIYTRTYQPPMSTCFMVTFLKLREVFAAAFRDRIIHHWICLRMQPLFEDRCHELGDVSHACRKGYGTKTAIAQVQEGMIRVSDHLQKAHGDFQDVVTFVVCVLQYH